LNQRKLHNVQDFVNKCQQKYYYHEIMLYVLKGRTGEVKCMGGLSEFGKHVWYNRSAEESSGPSSPAKRCH